MELYFIMFFFLFILNKLKLGWEGDLHRRWEYKIACYMYLLVGLLESPRQQRPGSSRFRVFM